MNRPRMTLEEGSTALLATAKLAPDVAWPGYRAGLSAAEFKEARSQLPLRSEAEQFLRAVSYLDLVPASRVKKIKARNSYNLKHIAERWSRSSKNPQRDELAGYVSNGILIFAAIYRGFQVTPVPGSLNAMIGKEGVAFDWPLPELIGLPRGVGPQIYFITSGDGLVKIGFSVDVEKRLRTLATGSSAELNVLLTIAGTRSDEKALHQTFKADRHHGEWFRLSPALQTFIDKHKTDPP